MCGKRRESRIPRSQQPISGREVKACPRAPRMADGKEPSGCRAAAGREGAQNAKHFSAAIRAICSPTSKTGAQCAASAPGASSHRSRAVVQQDAQVGNAAVELVAGLNRPRELQPRSMPLLVRPGASELRGRVSQGLRSVKRSRTRAAKHSSSTSCWTEPSSARKKIQGIAQAAIVAGSTRQASLGGIRERRTSGMIAWATCTVSPMASNEKPGLAAMAEAASRISRWRTGCSGPSWGKAVAPEVESKGQIYLHRSVVRRQAAGHDRDS